MKIGEITQRPGNRVRNPELIIVDESERLNATAVEMVSNRDNGALILIGMPGIEKKFNRCPQLYNQGWFHP